MIDCPSILLQKGDGGTTIQAIRSAVLVDDLQEPIKMIPDIMQKLDKEEILRHYRIANYKDIDHMLELIAVKKGLTELNVEMNGKKKIKKQVPNTSEASKRVIRDFIHNRLRYYSKV